MKILFIASLYDPYIAGGAEKTIQEQAQALKKSNKRVSVLTLGPHPGIIREEKGDINVWRIGHKNIYFHYNKIRPAAWQRKLWHILDIYNPFIKPEIEQVLKMERPDVISMHNMAGISVSAWDVAKKYNIPVVQVLHDQYLLCPKSSMMKDSGICGNQCLSCRLMRLPHSIKSNNETGVVGVSQFILDKLLSHGYFKDTPVKAVIRNTRKFGLDLSALRPRKADGNIVFGFIGTLSAHKGIELLLKSFLKHSRPNWKLLVAGFGNTDYEKGLKQQFANSRIEFLGYCKPEDFFVQIDVTVIPSIWEETLGNVVFESFTFGVPVVGSKRGGIPEMIEPGVNGLLFNPSEPGELLSAMKNIADNLGYYRSKHSEIISGSERFRDQDEWMEKWMDVYHRAIDISRSPAINWDAVSLNTSNQR